jgi:hypothetical protein
MIFGLTNIITIAYLTIKIGFVIDIDGEVVELLVLPGVLLDKANDFRLVKCCVFCKSGVKNNNIEFHIQQSYLMIRKRHINP